MDTTSQGWTKAHDLALVYVALAYGTDQDLHDAELSLIHERLRHWTEALEALTTQDVVVEAASVLTEEQGRANVKKAIYSLKASLSQEEREQAIQDVVNIAEADGVVISAEQNLLDILARAWDVKATKESLMSATTATVEALPEWSLLHDIGFLYVVLAHSTDNKLTDGEVGSILECLGGWQPELEEAELRKVMRTVVKYYDGGVDQQDLQPSLEALRKRLPVIQRLGIINDLIFIAQSDGVFTDTEQAMITMMADVLEAPILVEDEGA